MMFLFKKKTVFRVNLPLIFGGKYQQSLPSPLQKSAPESLFLAAQTPRPPKKKSDGHWGKRGKGGPLGGCNGKGPCVLTTDTAEIPEAAEVPEDS